MSDSIGAVVARLIETLEAAGEPYAFGRAGATGEIAWLYGVKRRLPRGHLASRSADGRPIRC